MFAVLTEQPEAATPHERFIRWQASTSSQLSTALSLLSGLSVAGLGFLLSLLAQKDFTPKGVYAATFVLALLSFLAAVLVGVAAVITRLLDFRLTARKLRDADAEPPRFFGTDATGYGKTTWRLFWILTIAFALGTLCSVLAVAGVYLGAVIRAVA